MRFTIAKDIFRTAIQRTLGISDRKSTIPILNYLLLKTEEEKLKLVATDREISLIARYDVPILEEGALAVSARKLFEMVRELPEGEVHCETGERGQMNITAGKVRYRLMGLPAEEFPAVLEVEKVPLYPIRAGVLVDLIEKTVYCASTDELRTNMNGVFMEVDESVNGVRLKMVATDGHRMAIAYSEPDEHGGMSLEKGILIPRRGVVEIRRLLDDLGADTQVYLGLDKGMLVVKTEDFTMKVGLIDQEFPDYKRAIPLEKGIDIKINREQMLHALRRMSVMSTDRYGGVVIILREGEIILNSINPDVGEASEELEVEYHGEEMRVGYNVRYLVEAIDVMKEEEVLFEIRGSFKPGVVRYVGSDQYASYIMPLRI